eukprot:31315-Pelagococcus_subviridis.AAC.15
MFLDQVGATRFRRRRSSSREQKATTVVRPRPRDRGGSRGARPFFLSRSDPRPVATPRSRSMTINLYAN